MIFIENESTLVWRFPIHISQSSLGGKTNLSNACTLIALKIAELIHIHNIDMPTPVPILTKDTVTGRVMGGAEVLQRPCTSSARNIQMIKTDKNNSGMSEREKVNCPSRIVSCLVNGIVDGNEAYAKDAGHDSTRVYNLPDAIKACDLNFAEIDFKLSTGSIKDSLPKLINLAVRSTLFQSERRLVFVMIGCIRTVLIVFDRTNGSLTLFDTHMHLWRDDERSETLKHGALIGTCQYSNLNTFADWVQNFVFPDIKKSAEEFEISLVQLTESGDEKARNVCQTYRKFALPIRIPVFQTRHLEEDKENKKELGYPVLRSILSRPPLKILRVGMKRRHYSKDGEESGCFGRKEKINRQSPT
ncbi:unnamed protein product [Caenorhabditis sp. 36 PRJEB53466]|nr:unnamed protein product [Caenorhabditis sp. 36 PRJEB53466]